VILVVYSNCKTGQRNFPGDGKYVGRCDAKIVRLKYNMAVA